MKLADYIKSFPRRERQKIREYLASELGVSESYIRSMSNGNKKILRKYAICLEQITNGLVIIK